MWIRTEELYIYSEINIVFVVNNSGIRDQTWEVRIKTGKHVTKI